MITSVRTSLADLEQGICDLTSKYLCIPRSEVHPSSRVIEDLHIDSLEVVEWGMAIEETYGVTLPFDSRDPASKAVFTRSPLRLKDVAEAVYLQWGTGAPDHSGRSRRPKPPITASPLPFTQLNGRWTDEDRRLRPLFEPIGMSEGIAWHRRTSDGMRCALLPAGVAVLGSDGPEAGEDERPLHRVELDSFLIDAEPVSTTAYCRFLNSIDGVSDDVLRRWVLLAAEDDRQAQMVIERDQGEWWPVAGTECAPMVLVSWFGAQAYALWAGGGDWSDFDSPGEAALCGLPSEAQWEHAAAGQPDPPECAAALHEPGRTYTAATMPLAAVHLPPRAVPVRPAPYGRERLAVVPRLVCGGFLQPA